MCGGCQIHVTNRETFRAVETGVALIEAFRAAGPDHFAWREPPYEYEYTIPPIDILYGSAALREGLAEGAHSDCSDFVALRERFLLYP